jgi:hypothetical protein
MSWYNVPPSATLSIWRATNPEDRLAIGNGAPRQIELTAVLKQIVAPQLFVGWVVVGVGVDVDPARQQQPVDYFIQACQHAVFV